MMQVADSGLFTARVVRGGYTHWLGPEFVRELRQFTGKVSADSINCVVNTKSETGLAFEHFLRIQKELTTLMSRHMVEGQNEDEFIETVKRLENVHIVTKTENTKLRTKECSGDYIKAGIDLVDWKDVPEEAQLILWKKIRGKVANSEDFRVAPK